MHLPQSIQCAIYGKSEFNWTKIAATYCSTAYWPDKLNGWPHKEKIKDDWFGLHPLFSLNQAEENNSSSTNLKNNVKYFYICSNKKIYYILQLFI